MADQTPPTDDERFVAVAQTLKTKWSGAPAVIADLLLGLTDEQAAHLRAWSRTGLQELIDRELIVFADPWFDSWEVENLLGLQAAITFWHEPRAAACTKMLTRSGGWLAPEMLFAKMVQHGASWTQTVVDQVLKRRTSEVPLAPLLSGVRHFDLPMPEDDRFAVLWAEGFAALPGARRDRRRAPADPGRAARRPGRRPTGPDVRRTPRSWRAGARARTSTGRRGATVGPATTAIMARSVEPRPGSRLYEARCRRWAGR
ncbi:MAG: hypothetical protein FWE61_00640, partial [Micrococcales bacterium]|nr:hypothetical protein [Micrococcales bacterium]